MNDGVTVPTVTFPIDAPPVGGIVVWPDGTVQKVEAGMDETLERIQKRTQDAKEAMLHPDTPRREKDLHRAYVEDTGYLLKRVKEAQAVAGFMVER